MRGRCVKLTNSFEAYPTVITESQRTFAIIAGGYDPISDTGFYGFVPSSDLIDGKHLSELLEFHKGTDQNSHSGWLKFYIGSHAICNHTSVEHEPPRSVA